jgi:hypothetical protein
MKKMIAILLLTSTTFGCQYDRQDSVDGLKEKLKKTMTDFLYTGVKGDSSVVKYRVLDVNYYAAPSVYDCEFKVNMKERNLDTIGIMKARVFKDWSKVERVY